MGSVVRDDLSEKLRIRPRPVTRGFPKPQDFPAPTPQKEGNTARFLRFGAQCFFLLPFSRWSSNFDRKI